MSIIFEFFFIEFCFCILKLGSLVIPLLLDAIKLFSFCIKLVSSKCLLLLSIVLFKSEFVRGIPIPLVLEGAWIILSKLVFKKFLYVFNVELMSFFDAGSMTSEEISKNELLVG